MGFFESDYKTHLPKNDAEAEAKFKCYKSVDPFPEIEPALLNSTDIFKYVTRTGMIFPFEPNKDKDNFRGATLAATLRGECMYWDEKGIQKIKFIEKEGDSIILNPNSITFVTLEPYFRIPEYIVLRFNLKITHVYKGLLLGTGPIVDPGYRGKLSIPLHNLTLNKYELKFGEELIWIEFTKLSRNSRWKNKNKSESDNKNDYEYIPFETGEKKDRKIIQYIQKALRNSLCSNESENSGAQENAIDNLSVRSTIPEVDKISQEAEKTAKKAESTVTKLITGVSIAAVLTVLLGIIPLVSLVNDSRNYVEDAKDKHKANIELLQKEITELRSEKEESDVQIKKLQNDFNKLLINKEKSTQNVKGRQIAN